MDASGSILLNLNRMRSATKRHKQEKKTGLDDNQLTVRLDDGHSSFHLKREADTLQEHKLRNEDRGKMVTTTAPIMLKQLVMGGKDYSAVVNHDKYARSRRQTQMQNNNIDRR